MVFSTTLLRQQLMEELQDGLTGVLTADGATSTAIDRTKWPEFGAGFLENWWYKALSGAAANSGQVRKTKAFTHAAGEVEFVNALPAATAQGDGYELHRRFHPDTKDTALRRALPLIWPEVYTPGEDRSIATVEGHQVYKISASILEQPTRVLLEAPDGLLKQATELMNWSMRRSGATRYLSFPYALPGSRVLRLEHMQQVTVDTDTLSITFATNTAPIVLTTATAHQLQPGDAVTIADVGGNTAANGTFTVTVLTSDTFALNGTTGNGVYASGGAVRVERVAITPRQTPILLAQAAVWLYGNEWGRATGQDKSSLQADLTFWTGELTRRKAELGMPPLPPTVHVPGLVQR